MSNAGRTAVVAAIAVLPPAAWTAIWLCCGETARLVLLAHSLYWLSPVLIVFALVVGWRQLRPLAAELWPGALLAAALTAAVFWLVPPEMRVQFDETSLASVSQNMHEQRLAVMTTGALPSPEGLLRLENVPDKRPPLWAFLTSVLHDVTGQRVANGFASNAMLLAAGLFLAFAAVRRPLGLAAATAAPLLLLAVPLVSVVATSAGFELLACVLFGLVLLAAVHFVQAPDSRRWGGFLGAGVLFAASRYESLPALLLLGVAALWAARGRWRPDARPDWRTWITTALIPGLVTPLVLQLSYARNPDFYPEAAGQPLASLQYFAAHLPPFLAHTFDPALANPLPGVLAIAGAGSWLAWLLRKRASRLDAVIGAPLLAVTALTLAWFAGDVREPISVRLYLPVSCACALLPLLLPAQLPALIGRRAAIVVLAAAAVLAALRIDTVRTGEAFPRTESAKLTQALDARLAGITADPAKTLWVCTAAQHLIVTGRAALSPNSFLAHVPEVRARWERGDITTVYVVETPIDKAMAPAFGDPWALLRAFRSEVVTATGGESPITVHRLLR